MATYCVIKPRVRTSQGERESKLFNDLLSIYKGNRKDAVRAYSYLKSDNFLGNYRDIIDIDDAGEPILSSVISKTSLKGLLDDSVVISGLNEIIGATKNGEHITLDDNTENYLSLSKKVVDFNRDNEYNGKYVALIDNNNGKVGIHIERSTDKNSIIATKIAKNYILNEKIRTILAQMGVSIDKLTNLQDSLGVNGVVDYENAEQTSNGFINLIRIAGGFKGEIALPEEFAHLMIDIMQDEPLVKRLLSSVSNIVPQILGDEYDQYVERYGENTQNLIREAAGKLVYRELVGNGVNIPKYRSFIGRVIDSIKNFIKTHFSKEPIVSAMETAEMAAQGFANRILNEDNVQRVQREQIKNFGNLYQLSSNAKKASTILQGIIDKSLKKYSFYIESLQSRIRKAPEESSNPNIKTKKELQDKLSQYQDDAKKYIGEINNELRGQNYNIGIERFISQTANELDGILKKIDDCSSGNLNTREKAFNLRNCKNILDSIESTINDINISLSDTESGLSLTDTAQQQYESIVAKFDKAQSLVSNQSLLTFGDYLSRYFKHTITIKASNGDIRKISKEDISALLKTAYKDIGLANTWLESAAESDDIIIQLTDQALKDSKERKRQRVLAIVKRLQVAAKKLNSTKTDFMFEKHEDGTLSNRYISDINWTLYKDREQKMLESLDEKYGKTATGIDAENKIAERNEWRRANQDNYGMPDKSIYGVDIEKILTKEQLEYYNEFMDIRDELIHYLPADIYTKDPYKAIQIRKDMWERLKTTSPSNWTAQFFEEAKKSLITNVDDTEFGKYKAITDFAGRQIMSVPIFFVNNVDEKELSRDTVSTLAAFADMAINYDEMMEIGDYLEIGKTVMENRDAAVVRGKTPLRENMRVLGQSVTSYVKKDNNNFVTRYNELLKSQYYGRYMNDGVIIAGNNWEIKSNKFAKVLNKISSLNQLALNGLAGFAAAANDILNVESEALAGQYFKHRHIAQADKIYLKSLAGTVGEIGSRIKTSKLNLFIEMFDVLHEYDNDIRDLEWDKSKTKKILSENSLYFFMHAGSHWGETRTALAQALATEITSDDGKEKSNLWDILEVKPIDQEHQERGAKLVVKDGYTLTQDDITKYTRKFMGLNERLFGAYNLADRSALQSTAIGQLVFLYRKFMVPAIERRFKGASYNLDLDQETEGYYRSTWNFLKSLAKEARSVSDIIKMYNEDLTDNQRANLARAVNELSMFAVLSIVVSLATSADWNKKDNPWHRRFIAYMSRRMKVEAGAFTPFGLSGELWDIIKSPAASINTLESFGDLVDVINPWNYEWLGGEDAIVKSGRYKGYSKAYRSFFNSPVIPMNRTIYKMAHPEESLIAFR